MLSPASSTEVFSTMMSAAGHRCKNRLFEWMMAGIMLGIAVTLSLSPLSIQNSAFHLMLATGIDQAGVTFLFFAFGGLRIAALIANGFWSWYGPRARALCALGGAFMWFQMMLALMGMTSAQGTISPGISVYFFLTLGEIVSCYRAARDARTKS